MLDQLNEAAARMGGQWVKLNRREHGVIEGDLIDFEIRPKSFEGAPVLSRKGNPREEWVLTLRCAPDPANPDDDGIRKLSLNESAQRALSAAIKESKAPADVGSHIKAAVIEDPPSDREQAVYKFQVTPPAPKLSTDPNAIFGGGGAAAAATPPADPFGQQTAAAPTGDSPF